MRIFAGTERGLLAVDGGQDLLEGRPVNALSGSWALLDGNELVSLDAGAVIRFRGPRALCLLEADGQLYVGTAEARLFAGPARIGDLAPVASFDEIPTRDEWYTPWGAPPDTRSLAPTAGSAPLVNVHVGGVWRHDGDGDGSGTAPKGWVEVVDVDVDTHQVISDPERRLAAVAAGAGMATSLDDGATWDWTTDGLHANYCRAAAIAGDTVLVSASTGPGDRARGALYRRPVDSSGPLEKCHDGLPEWFPFNIDTGQLVASGDEVVLGTAAGQVFRSRDAGSSWEIAADGLPPVRFVAIR